MNGKIFLNFAVSNVARSRHFFEATGFSIDAAFSNDDVAFVVISEDIFALFHSPPSLARHARNPISDPRAVTQIITAIGVAERGEVDQFADRALTAGAGPSEPASDLGFTYKHSFTDPDGHLFEVLWMDPAAVSGGGE